MVDNSSILTKLGQKIYNYFLEITGPGEPFLLLIEPFEYNRLKEETGNIKDVDRALKSTSSTFTNDYIRIAVANLQVQLIYNIDFKNIIDDSFYRKMKDFYPSLKDNNEVSQYFREIDQEKIWEKVRDIFEKEGRLLQIPKKKNGSGRFVQFPKSQRLVTSKELIEYADKFIKINLEPHLVLSFSDFCSKVYIKSNNLNNEEYEIIKKIVFSFYCNWDGSSTKELRISRQRNKPQLFFDKKNRNKFSENEFEFTLKVENEELIYYFDGKKVSEQDVKEKFKNKQKLSFLYDEEYEDWVYTTRPLHMKNRLLIFIDKHDSEHRRQDFINFSIFSTENYYVYHFQNCDNDIAKFACLPFITKEYFTIIGGIRIINCCHFRDDVLGAWYDFALPKIKLNCKNNIQVFIDSEEILINDNLIDLTNLILKTNKQKTLIPREKEYSIKCTDLPPVYFLVKDSNIANNEIIEKGWKISSYSLHPIKSGETHDISGLLFSDIQETSINNKLRSFLSKNDHLQNRLFHARLNKNITNIERRRLYGI
ncbi:MAG: hypothetical protein LBV17_08980 [Treponema sp.]|jgi:hypothetical protein|nr:hypothetical protein [Treponema sp.]